LLGSCRQSTASAHRICSTAQLSIPKQPPAVGLSHGAYMQKYKLPSYTAAATSMYSRGIHTGRQLVVGGCCICSLALFCRTLGVQTRPLAPEQDCCAHTVWPCRKQQMASSSSCMTSTWAMPSLTQGPTLSPTACCGHSCVWIRTQLHSCMSR
jgi:hypothetical protein